MPHMAPDETGRCACVSKNFEPNIRDKASCVCKAGLSLLPDEADCARELAYATVEGDAFECSAGLVYDEEARACVPAVGKTWKDVAAVCKAAGRVVSLDETECAAQCGTLETAADGVCGCVQYAQKSSQTGKCVYLTDNFVQQNGACVCRSGTLLDPAKADCIEELRYSEADNTAFTCRDGLQFVQGECKPAPGKTWADLAQVCNDAGRVVGLAGKSCDAACPQYQREVAGRCVCGAHMVQSGNACLCLTMNFERNPDANPCKCAEGLRFLPDEQDCVAELEYADGEDKLHCKDGLVFDSDKLTCIPDEKRG